nr:MAG TPA: hypothetical protein [Caudoviricetes sp.]
MTNSIFCDTLYIIILLYYYIIRILINTLVFINIFSLLLSF